ncbi:hypothetical protein [Polyangium mundeleinium]|uniref:Uncharacterized protein n=1 Tax=Polyangium mundeleinium TaxID=2995306 RepID=A0ABT5EE96_9BACT|nr:hypothetical protein [Polyangium mundeleinium]MDC0740128.1 hypothetical protein [Polyangium mundeleinium]
MSSALLRHELTVAEDEPDDSARQAPQCGARHASGLDLVCELDRHQSGFHGGVAEGALYWWKREDGPLFERVEFAPAFTAPGEPAGYMGNWVHAVREGTGSSHPNGPPDQCGREASSRATKYAERRYVVRSERTEAMEDFCAGWNAYEPTKECDEASWAHASAKYKYEGDWEVGRRDFRAGWDERLAWEQRYQRSA